MRDIKDCEFEVDTLLQYTKELEAKITKLEYEGQLQWDTHQMCQIINLKRIAELEAQNKALANMVEMQSEKISRLEEPKTCDGCKYVHITKDDPNFQGMVCTKTEMWDMTENFYCSYYEPKDD